MTLMLQRAVATLVLAAQAAGMGTGAAARAARVDTGAAAGAAAAAPAVQAATLYDDDPIVIPPDADLDALFAAHCAGKPMNDPTAWQWMRAIEQERARRGQEAAAAEEARRQQEAAAAEEARRQQEERERIARELAAQAAASEVVLPGPTGGVAAPPATMEAAEAPTLTDEFIVAEAPIIFSDEVPVLEAPAGPEAPATPEAPAADAEETETPAAALGLTPEQYAALQRMFGQNAAYASQQAAIEAQKRAVQQQQTVVQTPVPVQFKNLGTEEQAERLGEFLEAYPHGSAWDQNTTYKQYGGCTAYAFQALHTVYGEDADYVISTNINDIRQYSAVHLQFLTGGHWVFVTQVNEDGTFRTAEGNVNDKVCIGVDRVIRDSDLIEVVIPAKQYEQAINPTKANQTDVSSLNTATADQEARLYQFLAEHPHGSSWDRDAVYKNYTACSAFAIQAQQTIFGEDIEYECSDKLEDIRQYSAVFLNTPQGGHAVFVTKVNEDGTYQVAEGNVNGKVRTGCNWTIQEKDILQVWNPAGRNGQAGSTTPAAPAGAGSLNTATADGKARLDQFLAEHPHGSGWDENNTYKNYSACAAFAIQAQQTVFGEGAEYVESRDPGDIRQYSAVKEFIQGQGYHWYFVTSVNKDGTITVAEGNVNGKVEQGNTFVLDPNTVELVWNPKA